MLRARSSGWLTNRWIRILGVSFIMHFISMVDRTNIAMAIPSMRADLHLTASSIGFASGSLFFTYMVLQVPAGRLASVWSVRKLIFCMSIAWGIASFSTAFVHDAVGLTLNRLAVGLCEGGEMTAVIVLIRHWFSRSERARANTLFMMSVPLASVIASPISGALLQYCGWRWMFVIEALPAVIWAFVWLALIEDRPEQAAWLDAAERQKLQAELAAEDRTVRKITGHWLQVAVHPAVILLTLYNLLALMANWGVTIWLPTLLKESGISIATVGFLTALPYAAGAVMMILVSISSDRFLERKWHMILPTMLAGVVMLLVPGSASGHLVATLLCFVLVNGFFYGRFGPFWALPSEIFPASVVGVAIAMTNGIGNLGGFIGPFVFGYVKTTTNSFSIAIDFAGAAFILAGVLAAFIRMNRGRRDELLVGHVVPSAAAHR
jgi:MFS family permease